MQSGRERVDGAGECVHKDFHQHVCAGTFIPQIFFISLVSNHPPPTMGWVVPCRPGETLAHKHVLPVDQYWPGKQLPPHLSPFSEGVVTDHLGRCVDSARSMSTLTLTLTPSFFCFFLAKGQVTNVSLSLFFSDL